MALKWLEANLWRSLAIALAIWVAMMLVQIHGLPLLGGGLKPALASCTAQNTEFMRAQAEATALQAAALEDEEARTRANAKRSEQNHEDDLARAAAAGRDYAARNSVVGHRITIGGLHPESDRGEGGQAIAAAQSGGAGIPAEMPAGSILAISDLDLQACTSAATYAVGAHNWAATLPAPSPQFETLQFEPEPDHGEN